MTHILTQNTHMHTQRHMDTYTQARLTNISEIPRSQCEKLSCGFQAVGMQSCGLWGIAKYPM